MDLVLICSYVYGQGHQRIDFFEGDGKIYAKKGDRIEGALVNASEISESSMIVEGVSIAKKIEMARKAREPGQQVCYPLDQNFSILNITRKIEIIQNIEPEGFWRVDPRDGAQGIQLYFYDPR